MMKLRQLGNSSFRVSPIGIGLAALGRPGYITLGHQQDIAGDYSPERMESHAHQVLDLAYEKGVRYFDAARSYGKGEAFLASWLSTRGISPDEVSVGSKWGYTYTADWQVEAGVHEVKEHSLPVFNRQWKESRQLLGSRLGLYQIHSATLSSGVLENKEVLNALSEIKSREEILIGLSLSGPQQEKTLELAQKVQIDGLPLFDAVQATWNLLEPSCGATLEAARAAGMGIIVKEALANGRLTDRNHTENFRVQYARLQQQAQRLHTTIDALSIAAVLAHPWADIVLSGAAQTAHLLSNLQALEVSWDDEAAAALADIAEKPEAYWQIRSELNWN